MLDGGDHGQGDDADGGLRAVLGVTAHEGVCWALKVLGQSKMSLSQNFLRLPRAPRP